MTFKSLYLKRREDKRLRAGHLWIFSNEIDTKQSPLKYFEVGETVNVLSAEGKNLGSAYVNPHSLIAARVYDESKNCELNQDWFEKRLSQALSLREMMFDKPYYRLCFSDGDRIPGLIVDRFNDCFVLQINTAGIEMAKEPLLAALEKLFNPKIIVLRNDSPSRKLESLAQSVDLIKGEISEDIYIEENGVKYQVDVLKGQKTGWFYDQRISRQNMMPQVVGKSVLDVFSYTGSWSICAASAGASEVTAVDISQAALDKLVKNAEMNDVQDKVNIICDDAFNAMQAMSHENQFFDVVFIDPPAFIKRKKDIKEGQQAYNRANRLAMNLVKPGGLLISSSCSYHMSQANLQNSLLKSSRKLKRSIQILSYGHQGPDHPIHPAIEESAYLKTITVRVN